MNVETCQERIGCPLLREAQERGGHTPHVLEKAFAWHERYRRTGSMLESES